MYSVATACDAGHVSTKVCSLGEVGMFHFSSPPFPTVALNFVPWKGCIIFFLFQMSGRVSLFPPSLPSPPPTIFVYFGGGVTLLHSSPLSIIAFVPWDKQESYTVPSFSSLRTTLFPWEE